MCILKTWKKFGEIEKILKKRVTTLLFACHIIFSLSEPIRNTMYNLVLEIKFYEKPKLNFFKFNILL